MKPVAKKTLSDFGWRLTSLGGDRCEPGNIVVVDAAIDYARY